MFRWRQVNPGHQLARVFEAGQVAEFRNHPDGGNELDARMACRASTTG
jgi:hypothetical protein